MQKRKKLKYTHASLFSGIGGAELAASWMGWKNAFHCEISEFCNTILGYWFPNSIGYEDITTTDFTMWQGKVDILTGGFPCQPFSLAGSRLGTQDDRYLWPEMLRAIREIQPTWVVAENVNGILSMVQPGSEVEMGRSDCLFEESYLTREEQKFTISQVCENLEREGYAVQPIVIPACAVGAPHRRDRVWIVAHRADTRLESLQKRENEICKSEDAADTERIGGNEMVNEIQSKQPNGNRADCSCHERIVTNANCNRQRERTNQQKFEQGSKRKADIGNGCKNGAANSTDLDCPQNWWRNFPTQSPVCSRDDGISLGLADGSISFARWRSESIKALGNAWVPQVAYEIFKAIERHCGLD